ncbi:hypothetical protein BC628DRAFT_1378010 [Trametes gibbosa]|nr:hypothetical protein BC628DRAFT_1378010 [Trametes gibbosa]
MAALISRPQSLAYANRDAGRYSIFAHHHHAAHVSCQRRPLSRRCQVAREENQANTTPTEPEHHRCLSASWRASESRSKSANKALYLCASTRFATSICR